MLKHVGCDAAVYHISGIKLKMSTSYHLQTDSLSEQTNKTLIQALCFYVDRQQKGWLKALLCVCFELMNTLILNCSLNQLANMLSQDLIARSSQLSNLSISATVHALRTSANPDPAFSIKVKLGHSVLT